MFEKILPWLPLIGVIGASLIAGFFLIWNRRGGERAARRRQLPPTWPEMWARIEALETKVENLETRDRAFVNIINDTARQWPPGEPAPVFNPIDIGILNDTLPAPWKRAHRTKEA